MFVNLYEDVIRVTTINRGTVTCIRGRWTFGRDENCPHLRSCASFDFCIATHISKDTFEIICNREVIREAHQLLFLLNVFT